MALVVKYNEAARFFVLALFGNRDSRINIWLEKCTVICVIFRIDGNPVAFAFLHKPDFNFLFLDYVYTLEPHRRKGYAARLVEKLQPFCRLHSTADGAVDADEGVMRLCQLCGLTQEEIATLEKKEYPLLVDGAQRHHDNLVLAKSRYGSSFRGFLRMTDYFGVMRNYLTLVCYNDPGLVLGKPRYADNCCMSREYNVAIVDGNLTGQHRVEMTEI